MTRWSEGVNWGSTNVAGSMLVEEVGLRRVYQKVKVNRPKRENVAKPGRDRRERSRVPRDCTWHDAWFLPWCRGALSPCPCPNPCPSRHLTVCTHLEYTTSRLTSTIDICPRWPAATPRRLAPPPDGTAHQLLHMIVTSSPASRLGSSSTSPASYRHCGPPARRSSANPWQSLRCGADCSVYAVVRVLKALLFLLAHAYSRDESATF